MQKKDERACSAECLVTGGLRDYSGKEEGEGNVTESLTREELSFGKARR